MVGAPRGKGLELDEGAGVAGARATVSKRHNPLRDGDRVAALDAD